MERPNVSTVGTFLIWYLRFSKTKVLFEKVENNADYEILGWGIYVKRPRFLTSRFARRHSKNRDLYGRLRNVSMSKKSLSVWNREYVLTEFSS